MITIKKTTTSLIVKRSIGADIYFTLKEGIELLTALNCLQDLEEGEAQAEAGVDDGVL